MPRQSQQTRRASGLTDSASSRGRVAKRSCNACTRCRRQKIKCSGSQPCEACNKRKLSCEFDERDQKILVTRGYILDLQRKAAYWGRNEEADCSSPGTEYDVTAENADPDDTSSRVEEPPLVPGTGAQGQAIRSPAPRPRLDPVASALTNPLTSSNFTINEDGRPVYLGTSSNWSFTRQVLCITHEFVHQAPVPTTSLLFDQKTYDLGWDGLRNPTGQDNTALPTLDYAIYLINAVKFHCGQMFHLFDEESFMGHLYDFYAHGNNAVSPTDLWYIHFLVIIAFGKAFTAPKNQGKRPSGADFFVKAIQLLPDVSALMKEPIMSTELVCCVALYFQCLDFRHVAHDYIGRAMRMALGQGMHTDMPVGHLGEAEVQRRRRIWWTVYVLDREMTSLMGLPQSIHDDDVHPELPTFPGSPQRTAALGMQIKLSRVVAIINRSVYGTDGRLNSRFLHSTKGVLEDIAGLADELRHSFPLHLDSAFSGVSRTSAYLHLLYHQCIVLATRPLLFCFLKMRFEAPGTYSDALNSSQTAWNLMKMCVDSSQQMVNVLNCLRAQNLLETFLPFDLESLSVSTITLLLARVVDPQLLAHRSLWLEKAYEIFDEMAACGNVVGEYRRNELQQLDDMLVTLSRQHSRNPSAPFNPADGVPDLTPATTDMTSAASLPPVTSQAAANDILPSPISGILEELCFSSELTTAQIMDTANSIDNVDTEWMSHAIMEHGIWLCDLGGPRACVV